jgi:PBP1b-binding outer membrane lipoprotein LpoB
MRYRYTVVILLSIFLVACSDNKKEDAPIPLPKMEQILTDLHIAEVYSTMLDTGINKRNEKDIDSLVVFYKDVLTHHKVSVEQFKDGMAWYKAHPGDIDTCYKHMITDIARIEGADTTVLK